MKARIGFGLAAAVVLASGAVSSAQTGPIVVQYGTTTLNLPDSLPIDIDVGTVTSDLVVKIYDIATFNTANSPALSIPAVTISGTVGSGNPRLSVVICDGDQSFPSASDILMGRGAVDVAGLTITSDALRSITRAAIAVSGDITGAIDVGHIFRIQALGRGVGTNYTGGRILGDIIARASDTDPVTSTGTGNLNSIEVIHAGDLIAGNIRAGWDPTLSPAAVAVAGSIGRVFVGVEDNNDGAMPTSEPTADGITGEIRADKGHIGIIYTAGPIGSPSAAAKKLWAGDGIEQVRVVRLDNNGNASNVLDRDIKADIQANRDYTLDFDTFDHYESKLDAAIHLIETKGDISGVISAGNLTDVGNTRRYGIFTEGVISAPITIDLNIETADIVAASITAPITVGVRAKGAIVATNETSGYIERVEVGYSTSANANAYATRYPRAYSGTAGSPVNPDIALPRNSYTAADWLNAPPRDVGSADSVIRARRIENIKLANLTQFWQADSRKPYMPRIEAFSIGTLQIDAFRSGMVWSGRLEAEADGSIVNNPLNDYAVIENCIIGCMWPNADLWVTDCSRVNILNDLRGRVHLPALAAGETIRIGHDLGTNAELCPCDPASVIMDCNQEGASLTNGSLPEDSPRTGPRRGLVEIAAPEIGEVLIRSSTGLSGQVIVNGENNGSTWTGRVLLGEFEDAGNQVVIGPAPSNADLESPYYTRVSTALGGGAVGLAPFHFYPTDCSPPHDPAGVGDGIKFAWFDGGYFFRPQEGWHGIALARFYGPIVRTSGTSWTSRFDVKCRPFHIAGLDPCAWFDVSNCVKVYGPGPGESGPDGQPWPHPRAIGVRAKNGYHLGPGIYMLAPKYEDVTGSAEVAGFPGVVWDTVCDNDWEGVGERAAYVFVVSGDCDDDGVPDQHDPDLSSCLTPCVIADFNHTGTVTVQDIFDFLTAYFAGDPGADVNASGSVTIQDIFDYLAAYFSCPH